LIYAIFKHNISIFKDYNILNYPDFFYTIYNESSRVDIIITFYVVLLSLCMHAHGAKYLDTNYHHPVTSTPLFVVAPSRLVSVPAEVFDSEIFSETTSPTIHIPPCLYTYNIVHLYIPTYDTRLCTGM